MRTCPGLFSQHPYGMVWVLRVCPDTKQKRPMPGLDRFHFAKLFR
jgi:hypothetical protein